MFFRLAFPRLGVALLAAFLFLGGAGASLRWVLRRSGHHGELPDPGGRDLLRLLPGYVVFWLVFGGAFVCLARGLGLHAEYWVGTTAFAAAYFAGYVVLFAPAGLGIREGSLAGLFTPLLGMEASVVLSALQRVWITAVEIVGAGVGAVVLRRAAPPASAHPGPEVPEPAPGGPP